MTGSVTGMKGGVGVRNMLAGNLREAWGMVRSHGLRGGMSRFMGYQGAARSGPWAMEHVRRASSMRNILPGGMAMRAPMGPSYRSLMRGRQAGVYGSAAALGIGISAVTGISMFDQAQAGVGGYIGYGAGRRLGGRGKLGTALGIAGAIGGGGLGGYMGGQEWALGSLGYGAVRGAQALAGSKTIMQGMGKGLVGQAMPFKTILSRGRFGGGWGRAAGAAAGIGLGMLL